MPIKMLAVIAHSLILIMLILINIYDVIVKKIIIKKVSTTLRDMKSHPNLKFWKRFEVGQIR